MVNYPRLLAVVAFHAASQLIDCTISGFFNCAPEYLSISLSHLIMKKKKDFAGIEIQWTLISFKVTESYEFQTLKIN